MVMPFMHGPKDYVDHLMPKIYTYLFYMYI